MSELQSLKTEEELEPKKIDRKPKISTNTEDPYIAMLIYETHIDTRRNIGIW